MTAGCFVVTTVGAVIIGAASSFLGAISVHGVCGTFGTITVGLFSNESLDGLIAKGLFYGGGTVQLVSQVIGVAAIAAFVLVASTLPSMELSVTERVLS